MRRRAGSSRSQSTGLETGFAGVSIGADRLNRAGRSGADARRSSRDGPPLRPPGRRRSTAPRHRPGGRRSSTTRVRCNGPTSPGSCGAQERWPDVTVVFAILAGGAPIQLERLSSRGVDVRSSLHRQRLLRHRVVRPPGARAVHRDLRRRAARLRDGRPRRRPDSGNSGRRRVRRVGCPACPSGQPAWIAPVTGIETWLAGRLEADRDLTRPELLELSAAIGASARCGRASSVTTWSTGTTCRCTGTRTSTSG